LIFFIDLIFISSGKKVKPKTAFFDFASKSRYNPRVLDKILPGLFDLVFPRNCILCRGFHPATADDPLCPACFSRIAFNHPPFCVKCSRPLAAYTDEGLCADCRRLMPAFDRAWAATLYTGPMAELIPRYKFHHKTALRKTFVAIIRHFLKRYEIALTADIILPVPLHPARLRERGYNQSALIAESLAGALGIPPALNGLERVRHTPRQSELGQKDRFTNIRGAFRMKPSSEFTGKSVILVDDLLTTGATASEAAKTLKDAGAAEITVIALSIA
jgi:ComF family protein